MTDKRRYKTPRGFDDLIMVSDGEALTGLWFEGSRNAPDLHPDVGAHESPVLRETRRWLDAYFSGRQPDFTPPYRIDDLTPFRRDVVDAMLAIPFGATVTYGDIAAAIARKRGLAKMSAQAVGQAVGWNPICIIVPCHRVVGAAGALVGYGGGIRNKIALLRLEGVERTAIGPDTNFDALRERLARSRFRSRFKLSAADRAYVARKGWETLRAQAEKIVRERLAPAAPRNDGRQTPMRGHPVFIAQHATATCCRGCLAKWHGIPAGRPLGENEIASIVAVQLAWIREAAGDLTGFPKQAMLGI